MRDIAPLRAAAVGRHAAPVLSVYAGPMAVSADFDGVLVDSEPELSRVARTSCRLWPALTDECAIVDHLMDESAYVDRRRLGGQPLCGTGADGMPNWLEAKMRLLRPVIQSDADSLLLIRLCMEEALSPDARKRPLAVGEITENWGLLRREYGELGPLRRAAAALQDESTARRRTPARRRARRGSTRSRHLRRAPTVSTRPSGRTCARR